MSSSSGKPQTRGLAALLRIERERREREDTGADETAAPTPEVEQPRSAPHAIPHRVEPAEPEPEETPAAGDKPADATPETTERIGEEATATTTELHSEVATATQVADERQAAKEPFAAPVASLPRPRRASASRPAARPSRKKVAPASESSLAADSGWEKFVADWKPFLREGIKFKLCEFFYRNTAAEGRREFTTSSAQLSRVSGAHRRHIFLVLRQLEELKFIRKENLGTNKKDEGILIYFYPDRQL